MAERQKNFPGLTLTGREKPVETSVEHLCNAPGHYHYIPKGERVIKLKDANFTLSIKCATEWCNERGVDTNYESA